MQMPTVYCKGSVVSNLKLASAKIFAGNTFFWVDASKVFLLQPLSVTAESAFYVEMSQALRCVVLNTRYWKCISLVYSQNIKEQ